jgi:hypothetical protein
MISSRSTDRRRRHRRLRHPRCRPRVDHRRHRAAVVGQTHQLRLLAVFVLPVSGFMVVLQRRTGVSPTFD